MRQRRMTDHERLDTTSEGGSGEDRFMTTSEEDNIDVTNIRNGGMTPSGAPAPTAAPAAILSAPSPFFADATLDLEEAHDIAETPEATRPVFASFGDLRKQEKLVLPSLGSFAEEPPDSPLEKRRFTRISNVEIDMAAPSTAVVTATDQHPIVMVRTGIPRWPRDIPWAVAFWLVVPVSLVWPILISFGSGNSNNNPYIHHPLSTATIHTIIWAGVASMIVARALYRVPAAGGEGDDARHAVATALTLAAPVAVLTTVLLAVVILWSCPKAKWAAIVPMWYMIRDVYLFRRWKQRRSYVVSAVADNDINISSTLSSSPSSSPQHQQMHHHHGQVGYASRYAFFQALVSMGLDLLSRSLRRASFYRVLTAILLAQFGVILLWRWALIGALKSGSWFVFLMALVGGKWATGTLTRLLTLLASGGVMSWFWQQSIALQDMPLRPTLSLEGDNTDDEDDDEAGRNQRARGGSSRARSDLPAAYRTVDASVYQSVLDMDDVFDDDYELDDDEFLEAPSRREHVRREASSAATQSTVKSLLWSGLTMSFGSVAQCGLLGGPAQFVWSQIRKAEAVVDFYAVWRRGNGFQGMAIGSDTNVAVKLWNKINNAARSFVRNHSDLALTHVAAFHKGYRRAARDVAVLIDESGVEPILHDDITTHMCACVGGSISGLIVLFTGHVLLHQRQNSADDISDTHVVVNMILAFCLSYTYIFTVMEPLRAAIKAAYVCFAQYPQSLSQAFPLIYHRLSRLSDSSVS